MADAVVICLMSHFFVFAKTESVSFGVIMLTYLTERLQHGMVVIIERGEHMGLREKSGHTRALILILE